MDLEGVLAPEQIEALEKEYQRRQEEEPIRFWNQDFERRHHKQLEVVKRNERLVAVFGGNRSGKTVAGAVKTVLHALGKSAEPYVEDWHEDDQKWWYENYCHDDPIEAWVASISWDHHRDVIQPEVKNWIPDKILEKSRMPRRSGDVIDFIELPNGSHITFKSYESGRKAFQGKSLDLIWMDEECTVGLWKEIKQRVFDKLGIVLLTMTPINGLTWAYSEVYLNEAQDQEVYTTHFTWDDNPWLDPNEMKRLEATLDESELAVRKYGQFMAVGSTVLDTIQLNERKRELTPPEMTMEWNESGRFVMTPNDGELEIYVPPQQGRFYIIGADVSEGLPSGDNSAASVIDAATAEQVAELTVRVDTTTFTDQLVWLGRYYNTGMIVPERNNNGHAVVQRLDRELMYPNVYLHNDDERLGFPQNARTRPMVIAYLQDFARENPEVFNSRHLLNEGFTFVRNSKGRPEASGKGREGGFKDDRLFAFGIAQLVRDHFGPPLDVIRPSRDNDIAPTDTGEKWIQEDMDEDVEERKFVQFDPSMFVDFPTYNEREEK